MRDLRGVRALRRMSGLRDLSLVGTSAHMSDVVHIAAKLETLALNHSVITVRLMRAMAHIRDLSLRYCTLMNEAAMILATTPRTKLDLEGTMMDVSAITVLCAGLASGAIAITHLNLKCSMCPPASFLATNTTLVSLSWGRMTHLDATMVAMESNTALKYLDISQVQVINTERVAQMLRANETLESLKVHIETLDSNLRSALLFNRTCVVSSRAVDLSKVYFRRANIGRVLALDLGRDGDHAIAHEIASFL